MNNVISFTPMQVIAAILAICGGITCIAGAGAVLYNMYAKAKAPNQLQDERIEKLEKKVERLDDLLARDTRDIESINESNRLTQRALWALLNHGIDGNEIASMKKVKEELEMRLFNN